MPRWPTFMFIFFSTITTLSQIVPQTYHGEVSIANITPEEARTRAIRQALWQAIEQQCGINLQAEAMVKDFMLSGEYIHSVSYGQVVEEKIIKESVRIDQSAMDQPPALTYVVEMQIETHCEVGQPDPAFRVALKLNKNTFVAGEEMILTISATQDCYITVANFAEDKVYILVPSQLFVDNFLTANSSREFPSLEQRRQGMHLRLNTAPGQSTSSEVIQVIATKSKIDFINELQTEGGYGIMPTLEIAGTNLARWLSTIPVSQRAEAQALIEIRERYFESSAIRSVQSIGDFVYDTPPQPVGGFAAIAKNLVYPQYARKQEIEGTVYVKVLVNENGEIEETEIVKSGGSDDLDEAAIAAIKSVAWKPAYRNAEPIKVWVSIPVRFKIK